MTYVCADLHGCSPKILQQLLARAGFGDDDFLFILGDVIDRGEYGAELLLDRPAPDTRYFPDIRVIFGHTPTVHYGSEYSGRAFHTDTWSCIDAGCALGRQPMLLRLEDMREFYLPENKAADYLLME